MRQTLRTVLFFLYLFSGIFYFCGMDIIEHREELGTLKEQSVEEDEKGKITQAHKDAFKKVEAALLSQDIKIGISSEQIRSRYGAPSATSPEADGKRWLYRSPEGRGFLDKPWIFLYFDKDGRLSHWDCGHTKACSETVI